MNYPRAEFLVDLEVLRKNFNKECGNNTMTEQEWRDLYLCWISKQWITPRLPIR